MTRKRMLCAECGSDDVVVDAWAEWDEATQEFVLRSVFDEMFCLACEQACDINEVDIIEIDEVAK